MLPPGFAPRAGRRAGFTLVEIMIVVAIMGILAAIAVPNFMQMQAKAKRAELPTVVNGIADSQVAYHVAHDSYIDIPSFVPSGVPGKTMRPWPAGSGFETLGWAPDGEVRGSYKCEVGASTEFNVTAQSDVDGDGVMATYFYSYDAVQKQPSVQGFTTPADVY
jgi:type IV pilus assembly protein PilA